MSRAGVYPLGEPLVWLFNGIVTAAAASRGATQELAQATPGTEAALLAPASLALIGATYPKDDRAGAVGVWAADFSAHFRRRPGRGRLV